MMFSLLILLTSLGYKSWRRILATFDIVMVLFLIKEERAYHGEVVGNLSVY